jgi:hypothetical protein
MKEGDEVGGGPVTEQVVKGNYREQNIQHKKNLKYYLTGYTKL